MDATLPAVAEELLKEIEKVFHETSHGQLSVVTNCQQSQWKKKDNLLLPTVVQETEFKLEIPSQEKYTGLAIVYQINRHALYSDLSLLIKSLMITSGLTVVGKDQKAKEPSACGHQFGNLGTPITLDLVDCQAVTRIVSPSGRAVYQVLGSSRKLYHCYSSCHFCPCPAFAFSVLRKGDSLLCKHLLAIYLSQAMGTCQELTVSDKQLTRLLLPEEEGG